MADVKDMKKVNKREFLKKYHKANKALEMWRIFKSNRLAVVGLLIFIVILLLMIFANVIADYKTVAIATNTLCGKGNYSADVEEGTYQLLVKIERAAKHSFNAVESLLNRVVPQNMVVNLIQVCTTHAELGRFTHAQLAAYTHDHLRNEVLNYGE